jgi:hypothetical protein
MAFLGVQIEEGFSFKIKICVDFFKKLAMLRENITIILYHTDTQLSTKIKILNIMSKDSRTTTLGRNAGNGRFATVEKAREHPKTYIVERVPKPGYGDTKKKR